MPLSRQEIREEKQNLKAQIKVLTDRLDAIEYLEETYNTSTSGIKARMPARSAPRRMGVTNMIAPKVVEVLKAQTAPITVKKICDLIEEPHYSSVYRVLKDMGAEVTVVGKKGRADLYQYNSNGSVRGGY